MAETKTTIRIEDEVLHRLKVVALQERKTVSEIVRGLITAYVTAKEKTNV
jgi:predicted DNA-binding protein